MEVAQLNARLDANIKREGDATLARYGVSATEAIRALWTLLAKTKAGLDAARKNLSDSEVRAPFAGTVVRKLKDLGDFASPGTPENSYAMIMGYPGSTQRYQTAAQLEDMIETNRIRIDARTVRQDIMWEAMCADPSVQLKYADTYAGSANGWKKWQGEELAFKNLNIIGREKEKEAALKAWIDADPARKALYGDPVATIAETVAKRADDRRAVTLVTEAPYRIELVGLYSYVMGAYGRALQKDTSATFGDVVPTVKERYRDYVADLDKKEAVALLDFYRKNATQEDYLQIPGHDFATMDFRPFIDSIYDKSVFVSYGKLSSVTSPEQLFMDPAAQLAGVVTEPLMKRYNKLYREPDPDYDAARKHFAGALMEWQKGQAMYPDANFTMRLTYGNVLPYSPKDGLKFLHYTTAKGLLEKENPDDPEFILPSGIKDLLLAGDYGRWADKDGTLHTCFLTNNDITGGNSGSPVLDARGNLIGLAFDGNWESMSSDVMFEPELQRCICVDIRYVLWLIEKYGKAYNIINEITYVK